VSGSAYLPLPEKSDQLWQMADIQRQSVSKVSLKYNEIRKLEQLKMGAEQMKWYRGKGGLTVLLLVP
jgi:hypothetical protein